MKMFVKMFIEPPSHLKEIHFLKHTKEEVTMDNIREVIQVSSMRSGAASSSLYHLLAKVYVPLIRGVGKEEKGGNKGRKSLEDNLYALRSTLYMLER
jgi:hypothetical protein